MSLGIIWNRVNQREIYELRESENDFEIYNSFYSANQIYREEN